MSVSVFAILSVDLMVGINNFFGGWGLSINETLVIVAILLMILDFFLSSDILTHVAYVLFCVVFARLFPVHILYQVLFGVIAWFAVVAFHYTIWKSLLQRFINQIIAPDMIKTGAEGVIGLSGGIREIEGKMMVELNGDLWAFHCDTQVRPGDTVRVTSIDKGMLIVTNNDH